MPRALWHVLYAALRMHVQMHARWLHSRVCLPSLRHAGPCVSICVCEEYARRAYSIRECGSHAWSGGDFVLSPFACPMFVLTLSRSALSLRLAANGATSHLGTHLLLAVRLALPPRAKHAVILCRRIFGWVIPTRSCSDCSRNSQVSDSERGLRKRHRWGWQHMHTHTHAHVQRNVQNNML